MGIWSKAKKKTKAEPGSKDAASGTGSSWTQGRAIGGVLGAGVLYAAIACGPLALVVASTSQPQTVQAEPSSAAGLTAAEQSAGSYALGFVAAWLSATRDDDAALRAYVDVQRAELPAQGTAYRDLAVSSIVPVDGSTLVAVIVSANVRERDLESEDGGEIWPRRYFQAAVRADGASLAVVGLPASIAAPSTPSGGAQLVYGSSVDIDSPASQTVSAFMNAYLAGSGDIERYTSPDTDIAAVAPAPFVGANLSDLRADEEPSETPADGEQTEVLATVAAQTADEQALTSTYALTLTARAGRWEVSELRSAPLIDTTSSTTTTEPSTVDGTLERN